MKRISFADDKVIQFLTTTSVALNYKLASQNNAVLSSTDQVLPDQLILELLSFPHPIPIYFYFFNIKRNFVIAR